MVGCWPTLTRASLNWLSRLVRAEAISCCERSRSAGGTSERRMKPELTLEAAPNPGDVMVVASASSGTASFTSVSSRSMISPMRS